MPTAVPQIDAGELFGSAVETEGVLDLRLADVLDSPYQTRKRPLTRESVAELMTSLKAAGQLQPIIASPAGEENPGKYYVHAGHRRCAALRYLGAKAVRARVENLSPLQARKVVFCENQGREDVSAVELAEAISQFAVEKGCDFKEAARELGVQERTRKRLAPLVGIDSALRDALVEGAVSARVAELLARLDKERSGLGLRRAMAFRSGRTTITKLESELKQLREGEDQGPRVPSSSGIVSCELDDQRLRLRVQLDTFDTEHPDVALAVDALTRCLRALTATPEPLDDAEEGCTGPGGPARHFGGGSHDYAELQATAGLSPVAKHAVR